MTVLWAGDYSGPTQDNFYLGQCWLEASAQHEIEAIVEGWLVYLVLLIDGFNREDMCLTGKGKVVGLDVNLRAATCAQCTEVGYGFFKPIWESGFVEGHPILQLIVICNEDHLKGEVPTILAVIYSIFWPLK